MKERRKQFLDQITAVLKPLGFRKRGNQWRRQLDEHHIVYLWAEKSSYGDHYNFPLAVEAPKNVTKSREYCTIRTYEPPRSTVLDSKDYASHLFDWQLGTTGELTEILDRFLREYIEPPLAELGRREYVWRGCFCKRDCCEQCWVEKNAWEAREG